tara:strand:+ start:688 stop:1140 length:453 start_codon:yes stop_codon:yes gene_type:complete
MLSDFKEIEVSLETIILANGFEKVFEKTGKFGAEFLYKAEDGLYFQIKCDYQDRLILLFIGHRYILKNEPDQYFISGPYKLVVRACSDSFEEVLQVKDYSGWQEYSKKLITYLASSLPVVLERLTPAMLEEFAQLRINRRPPQFHFCRAD